MSSTSITIETSVSASRKKVWDFWTSPEHITKWNFASDDWHCPSAENDLRNGGSFKYTMASKDGEMSFEFEGIYDEVIALEKISYTMADNRKVIVFFEETDSNTKITETFDAEDVNSVELQRNGWQCILENFKKHVENSGL